MGSARRTRPVIAIDGPAGAGKSTLAAHLRGRFGFLNLETGAMYRALALKAIEHDLSFDEEPDCWSWRIGRGLRCSLSSKAMWFCWMGWMCRDGCGIRM